MVSEQNSKFAPAGYGLGESNALSVEDCNTAVKTGLYSFAYNTINRPEHLGYGVIFPIARLESSNAKEIIQIAKGCGNGTGVGSFQNRITAVRSTEDGITWTEWEYENPPMALGTEYRTTERHEGKPVYTKFVNFGALPNASTGYLNNALPINAYAFSIEGFVNTSAGYAHRLDPLVDNLWSATGYGYIGITTSKDMSGYDAYLKLKYTKE